jgi:hypothetical protein
MSSNSRSCNDSPRNRKAVYDFRGKRSRLNSAGVGGVALGPDARFESFYSRNSTLQKEMMDHKAAFPPACDCGLGKELVAVSEWQEEARLQLNDGNAYDSLFFEETGQRQPCIVEESASARVEPFHVLGTVDDARGTTVPILDQDAFLAD